MHAHTVNSLVNASSVFSNTSLDSRRRLLGHIGESDFAYCHSVLCLFVCHVRALCSNGRRYRQDFLCIRQPHVSHRSH